MTLWNGLRTIRGEVVSISFIHKTSLADRRKLKAEINIKTSIGTGIRVRLSRSHVKMMAVQFQIGNGATIILFEFSPWLSI